MTKTQAMIDRLRAAIARGETRTRRQWAAVLNTPYPYLCQIIRDHDLLPAIQRQRAESPAGILLVKVRRRSDGPNTVELRIPQCAIHAAGFRDAELRYCATPGRIVIDVLAEARETGGGIK